MEEKKKCRTCQEEKNINKFRINIRMKEKYRNDCKKCESEKRKKYQEQLKTSKKFEETKKEINQILKESQLHISNCNNPINAITIAKKSLEKIIILNESIINTSTFSFKNQNQDDFSIKSIIQTNLLKDKLIINPEDIKIERNHVAVKITIPETIKLTPEQVTIITNLLNLRI